MNIVSSGLQDGLRDPNKISRTSIVDDPNSSGVVLVENELLPLISRFAGGC
jgi:hypothetical protein